VVLLGRAAPGFLIRGFPFSYQDFGFPERILKRAA
jgi:hypothetical protein